MASKPKFSTKTNNYATTWLRNAMKSVGASYGASIKQISPNIYDVASAGVSSSRKIVQNIRQNRYNTNRIGDTLKQNKYVQYMQTAYKNALTDIKTGNFDNQERMLESMSNDISDSIEEMSGGFSFGDDGAESNVNINVVDGGASSGIASLQTQIRAQSESSIKMQKASMDAFVAVNAASMQQIGQLGAEVVGHLSNISSQLGAIVQYNNDTMTRYIEASMTYFDKVGSNVEKMAKNDEDKLSSKDLMNGAKGGFNYSKYKAYVKQQFKDTVSKSNLGMLKTLLEDDTMIKMAVSNPMGFLTNGLTSYMMPKVLKTSLESMEKTFNEFMPSLLEQLGDLANDTTSGWMGTFKRALGNTLGIKNDRSVNFKDAKIERGPIPFDGETKHAITEVITKELRDQTGYLQIIAEHYKKNARDTVKKNGEYWDWTSNSYQKMGGVTDKITQMMLETISNNMKDSSFGKAMQGAVDSQKNKKAQADVEKTLNELYVLMEKETRFLNFDDILKLIEQTNGSEASVKLLKKWLGEVKKSNPNAIGNASAAKLSTQTAMKNLREEIKDNPTLYKLFDSEYGGLEDIDKIDAKFLEQLGLNKKKRRGQSNVKVKNAHYTPGAQSSKVGRSYSDEGKTSFGQRATKFAKSAMDNSIDIMRSIMNGDTRGVIDKGASLIAGVVTDLGSKMNKKLFGEKNERGYRDNGIFSGMANGLTDMVNSLKYKITGNEYTDSKGQKHAKNGDTVLGRLTQVGDTIKDSIMMKLFGKSKDENGDYVKKGNGIVDTIGASFKSAADSFKEFLFGDTKNGKDNRRNKGLIQNVKNAFNKGFYGNGHKAKSKDEADLDSSDLIGKAAMGTAAGGLLGYLVGGPVVGSMLGFATTVVRHSDKFREFLFGKEDGLTLADGSKTKKHGLFGVVNNYLSANLFTPLKRELNYIKDDVITTVKHDILSPIAFGAEFFAGKIGSWFGDIFNNGKEKIDGIGSLFGSMVKKIFPGATEAAGNLLTTGLHAAYETGAKIVKAPGKLLVATIKALGIGDKIKAFFKPFSDMIKGGLRGVFRFTKDVIKDTLRVASTPFRKIGSAVKKGANFVRNKVNNARNDSLIGKIRDNYNAYDKDLDYNDKLIEEASGGQFTEDSAEARNWLAENSPETLSQLKDSLSLRMKLNSRESKKEHNENKQLRQLGREFDKNGKLIAKWTKGQFSSDSEEARSYLLMHDPDKLKQLNNKAYDAYKNKVDELKGNTKGDAAAIARGSLIGLSEEGKQTTLLAKIWDILFRKEHDNKSEDEVNKENEEANKPKAGQKRRVATKNWGYRDEVYNEETGEWEEEKEKSEKNKSAVLKNGYKAIRSRNGKIHHYEDADGNRVKKSDAYTYETSGDRDNAKNEDAKLLGSYALRDIADFGKFLGGKIKGVFSDKSRQHADGGFLKKGWNLVGEKGAELVNWASGKVKNSEETSSVIDGLGEASSDESRKSKKNALNALFNRSNKKQQKDLADEKAAIAKDELEDVRSDSKSSVFSKVKDAATMMKEKAEEKFRKDLLAASERTANASEEGTKTNKGFSDLFSKIFSKKGLITAAVLGGFIFLKKYAPGLLSALGSVLKGIGSAVGWIINIFAKKKDSSYNTNGESAGEVAGDILDNYLPGDIDGDGESKWNPLQLQDDGSASSLTMPTVQFLARTGFNVGKGAYAASKGAEAVTTLDKIAEHIPILGKGAKIANTEKKIGAGIYKAGTNIKKAGSSIKTGIVNGWNKLADTKIGNAIIGKSDWAKLGGGTAAKTLEDGTTAIQASAAKKLYGEGTDAALAMAQDGIVAVDDTSKGLTALGEKAKSGISSIASKVTGKTATSESDDLAKGAAKIAASQSDNVAGDIAKTSAKSGREVLAGFMTKFSEFIISKAESSTGATGIKKVIATIFTKIGNGIKKLSDKLVEKTVAETAAVTTEHTASAAVSFGISEAVFATIGAVNGVSGTAKLFKCESKDVDATMRIVAGIFGALTGTTLGSIVDIILTVVSACIGVDVLSELAVALYKKLVGEDSEKAQKLLDSQKELTSEYEESRDAKIEEQYNTQKAAGLTDKSLDEFKESALAGNENVKYKSFDDYNTDVNGSWGDKLIGGIGKGLKSAGHGIAKGFTTVFGGEKTYTDSNGNTYTKNSDGSYEVHDKDGKDLGYVSKDAIPEDATVSKSQGLVSKGWNAAKGLGSKAVSGLKSAGATIAEAGSKAWSGAKNLGSKALSGLQSAGSSIASFASNAFTSAKDTISSGLEKAGNIIKHIGGPALKYIKGETDTVEMGCPDDNPGKPIIDTLGKVIQHFVFPVRSIVTVGKKLGSFIGEAVDGAKKLLPTVVSESKDYVLGTSDSVELTDKTGISPLGVLGKVVQHFLTLPRSVVFVGKKIGGFIGSAVDVAKEFIPTLVNESKDYVLGTSDSVELTDETGLSPLGVVSKVVQHFLTLPRSIVKVGKSIGSFIGSAVNGAKELIPTVISESKDYVLGNSDDIELTDETGISPLGVLGSVVKHFLTLPRNIVKVGKSIGSFIGSAVTEAKELVPEVVDQSKDYVLGKADSIELTDETGLSPLGVLGSVVQHFLTLPRSVVKIGKSIGEFIGDAVDSGKDVGEDLIDKSKKYINGDIDKISLDLKEDNIFKPIADLITGVANIVLTPVKWIAKLFGGIKDTIDSIGDGITTAKDWVGDKVNSAGNAISSGWNSLTSGISGAWNYLTGGSGDGATLNGGTYYSQNDPRWKNSSYNLGADNGTMGDTGCGPTAAAMAFSDITGQNISPLAMANLAKATGNRDQTGTNWNFINDASNAMGMNSTQIIDPSAATINAELDSGNPVILSGTSGGNGANPYTSAGHYVVAVGKDSAGNIIINDPRGTGYSGKYNINDVASHTGSSWTFGGMGRRNRRNVRGGRGTVQASKVINIAKNEIGYLEKSNGNNLDNKTADAGSANYTKFGRDMNKVFGHPSHDAWCATFVTWCFWKAAGENSNLAKSVLHGATTAGCSNNASAFKSAGKWISGSETPKPGYVIFYTYSHTGIVSGVDGGYVYTIEGNTGGSNDYSRNGGCVYSKKRKIGDSNIKGYGVTDLDVDVNVTNLPTNGVSTSGGTTYDSSSSSSSDSSSSGTSKWSQLTSYVGNFFSSFADKALSGLTTGTWDTDYSSILNNATSSGTDSSSTSYSSGDSSNLGTADNVSATTGNSTARKGETVTLPSGLGTVNSFMGWQCITSPSSNQYKLRQQAGQKFDNNGYGKINGRYTVATTTTYGNVGDYIDIKRSDGSVLKAVIADIKNQSDAGCNKWGHQNGNCVVEFVVDKNSWYASNGSGGKVGYSTINNTTPGNNRNSVVSITNQGSFFNGGSGTGPAKRKYATVQNTSKRNRGGRGADIASSNLLSSLYSTNSNTSAESVSTWTANVNKNDSINTLVFNAIQILSEIAVNTGAASNKLDALKNLTAGTGSSNVIVAGNNDSGDTTKSILTSNTKTNVTSTDLKYQAIAKGGY